MVHIGQRIKEVFDQQPKGHNIEWFAAQLNCRRSNIYNIFSRSTIDTDLLYKISKILNHDFFTDLMLDFNKRSEDERNEKSEIYREIMGSIGDLLNKKLEFLSPEYVPFQYILNKDDDETSLLPASQFEVSVKSRETDSDTPHIHILSKKESFEITYSLLDTGEASRFNVISYGQRSVGDSYADVLHLINKWLEEKRNSGSDSTDNKTFAAIVYNALNSK